MQNMSQTGDDSIFAQTSLKPRHQSTWAIQRKRFKLFNNHNVWSYTNKYNSLPSHPSPPTKALLKHSTTEKAMLKTTYSIDNMERTM